MRDGKAGHKKMKYYSHYKERKITFLDQDLTISENPLFGFKWITNEDLFLAYLKNPRAKVFEHIWKFDFFGEKDLLLERMNERRNERVMHYRYENDTWNANSTCNEYHKVSSTKAIITLDELSYLFDVVKGKSLSVSCDKIEEEIIEGEKLLLMKHQLLENKVEPNNEYYLLYYIDLDGNVKSSRLNTFTHQISYFNEEELFYQLEKMRESTECILKNEQLQLKRSIK